MEERTNFMLRLPPALAEWLQEEANAQGVSRNQLIADCLEAFRKYITEEDKKHAEG